MRKTALLLFFLTFIQTLFADSPLTSTEFWKAYSNEGIVRYVRKKGKMDKKIATFLMNEKMDVGLKAAVCNALGWNIDGQNNGSIFLNFLAKKYHHSPEELDMDLLSADETALYGYLLAMDDYFNVKEAISIMDHVAEQNTESFTLHMLRALVKAQDVMDYSFCEVYKIVEEVKEDDGLKADMKTEAVTEIMDYINLYREDCN